jgi:hypothetical protein
MLDFDDNEHLIAFEDDGFIEILNKKTSTVTQSFQLQRKISINDAIMTHNPNEYAIVLCDPSNVKHIKQGVLQFIKFVRKSYDDAYDLVEGSIV